MGVHGKRRKTDSERFERSAFLARTAWIVRDGVVSVCFHGRFRATEESSGPPRRPGTKDYSVYAKRLHLPDLPDFVPLSSTEAEEDVAAVLPPDARSKVPQLLRRRGGDSPGPEAPASPRAAPPEPEQTSSASIKAYETAAFSGSDVPVPSSLELEPPAAVLSGWVASRIRPTSRSACGPHLSDSRLLHAFPPALAAAVASAGSEGIYQRRWRQDPGGSFLVNLAADIGAVPLQLHALRHAWHAPTTRPAVSAAGMGSASAGFSAHYGRAAIGMASLRLDLSLTQRLEALACRSEERDRRFLMLREDYVDRLRAYLVELQEQEELLQELQRAAKDRAEKVRHAADQNADLAHWLTSVLGEDVVSGKVSDKTKVTDDDDQKNAIDDVAFAEEAEEHAMWRAFMACTGRHIPPDLAAWAQTEPRRRQTGQRRLTAPVLSAEEAAHAVLLQQQNDDLRKRLADALGGGASVTEPSIPAASVMARGDLVQCPVGCGFVMTQCNKSPFITRVALQWGAVACVPARDISVLNRAGELGGGPAAAVSRGISQPVSHVTAAREGDSNESLLWGRYGSSSRKEAAALRKSRNMAAWMRASTSRDRKKRRHARGDSDGSSDEDNDDDDDDDVEEEEEEEEEEGEGEDDDGDGEEDEEDEDDDNASTIPDGFSPGTPIFRSGWAWGVPRGVPLHLDPTRGSSSRGFAVGVVDHSRREGFRPLPQPMRWPRGWLRPVRAKAATTTGGKPQRAHHGEGGMSQLSESATGQRGWQASEETSSSSSRQQKDSMPVSPSHSGLLVPSSPTSLGHLPMGSPSSDGHGSSRELQQYRAEVRRLQFQLRVSLDSCSEQRRRLTQARMNAALLLQSLNDLRALLAQSREEHRRKAHEAHVLRGQIKRAENRFLRAVRRGWADAPFDLLQEAEVAGDPHAKKLEEKEEEQEEDDEEQGEDDDEEEDEKGGERGGRRNRNSDDGESDEDDDGDGVNSESGSRVGGGKKQQRAWRRQQQQHESDVSSASGASSRRGAREKVARASSKGSEIDNGSDVPQFGEETPSLEKEGSSRKRMRPDEDDDEGASRAGGRSQEDEDEDDDAEAGSRSSAKRRRVASSGNGSDRGAEAVMSLRQPEAAKQMQGRRRRRRRF